MGYIMDLRKIEGVGHRPLIMVAGVVFLFDEQKRVLLQRRRDDGTWCAPGGSMELGETPEQAAVRECEEEVGLRPEELRLFNVISGEDAHMIYPNGDEVYAVDFNFVCRRWTGEMRMQEEEVLELRFFEAENLPEAMHKNDRRTIAEIMQSQIL